MNLKLVRIKIPTALLAACFLFVLMPPLLPVHAADGYLEWSGDTFYESDDNDGSIDDYIVVTLDQDDEDVEFVQVTDMVDEGYVEVDNLPDGLTCRVRSMDETTVRIYLDGEADDHEAEDSIGNLNIIFMDDAFDTGDVSAIEDSYRRDLIVEFKDAEDDEYDGTMDWDTTKFTEDEDNDGSIANEITIVLDIEDDDFDGFEESDDMIDDGMAEVRYLPEGLTCIIATEDETNCTIRLKGKAKRHDVDDYVDYMGIKFLDSAFTNGDASRVENSSMNEIEVIYFENDEEIVPPPVVGQSIVASFMLGSPSYTVNNVSNQMDVVPFAENERTYVPIRYLAYCLGMNDDNLSWDPIARTATLTEGETVVILQIGNLVMIKNGVTQVMDVAPIADSDRIFLPARFVVEAFNGSVSWNQSTSTVTINR